MTSGIGGRTNFDHRQVQNFGAQFFERLGQGAGLVAVARDDNALPE